MIFAQVLSSDLPTSLLGIGLALLAFSAPLTTAIYGRYASRSKAARQPEGENGYVRFREFATFQMEIKVTLAEIKAEIRELLDKASA